jgi:hypothetical protein
MSTYWWRWITSANGWKPCLAEQQIPSMQKNVPRHSLPSVWHSKNCDKRWRVTFHRSKVPRLLIRSQCESQGSHTISSPNKWASRNFEQNNEEHTTESCQ